MAEVWINGGELNKDPESPAFAMIEYTDGLSSDIPNLPTIEQVEIEEDQKQEEETAKVETTEKTEENQAQTASGYSCDKKSANIKYDGSIVVKRHKTQSSSDVCLTSWHSDLKKCKAFAEKHNIPMIAVWSNGSQCPHCLDFASAVASQTFRDFQKTYKIVWCYVNHDDSGSGDDVYNFCMGSAVLGRTSSKNPPPLYPMVVFWWKRNKKIVFDVVTYGDVLNGTQTGTNGGKKVKDYIEKKFKNKFQTYDYNPNV